MNNAKVLPEQTLQSKHYSFPSIHIPAGVYSFVEVLSGDSKRGILFVALKRLQFEWDLI